MWKAYIDFEIAQVSSQYETLSCPCLYRRSHGSLDGQFAQYDKVLRGKMGAMEAHIALPSSENILAQL